ncbi:sugar transferase [Candidatus Parcubacteria bacterium]|nr:MAG: sugar transferase [Candidatus Parcubacteria bacterium]
MLKEKAFIIVNGHRILDTVLTVLAFISSYFVKKYLMVDPFRGLSQEPNYYTILLMIVIIWYLAFNFFELYQPYRNKTIKQILWELVKAVFSGFILLNFFIYLFRIPHISRLMMLIFLGTNLLLLGITKSTIFTLLKRYRQCNFHKKNIIIVGDKKGAEQIIDLIKNNTGEQINIIGCVTENDSKKIGCKMIGEIEIICILDSLESIIKKFAVDELVFSIPLDEIKNVEKYIAIAEEMGICVRVLPEWFIHPIQLNPLIGQLKVENFLGVPTLTLTATPVRYGELFIKHSLDYILCIIFLVLSAPFIPLFSVMIKLCSDGPTFYKQERLGLNGRRFILYKFRTMTRDAQVHQKVLKNFNEADGPVFKIKKDPRIIPCIGHFLRRTNLDELPQLFNVLRGEMSLVGPRPPIPEEVEEYDIWQRRRLSMKPGITCLWQITLKRNDITFKEWMELDLRYIDNWSLMMDFKIILKTFWVMLRGTGR